MAIEQSTARTITFLMVLNEDAADPNVPFVTRATGKSPTVQISKNGAAFANTSNAASEISNGWYKVTLTGTETNTEGDLIVRATATGCAEWADKYEVQGAQEVTLTTAEKNVIADHILNRGLTAARDSGNGDTPSADSAITALRSLLNFEQDSLSPTTFNIKDDNGVTIGTITVDFAASSTGASSIAVA